MFTSDSSFSQAVRGLSLLYALCSGCADEQPTQVEEAAKSDTAAAPTQSSPVTTIPTTLSFEIDGEQRNVMGSANLSFGLDGSATFSAFAHDRKLQEMFSLHFALEPGTRLTDAEFEFESGVPQANEFAILRGELPDVTSLRSVSGKARFEEFEEEELELIFGGEMSADPFGGGDKVIAKGTVKGAYGLTCLKEAEPSQNGSSQADDGSGTEVVTKPEAECRAQLEMLQKP